MHNYDEFEAEMQAAGWSLEQIEEMYQAHLLDKEIERDESMHLNSLPPLDNAQVHSIGCICGSCSATYERESRDPRG